MRSLRDESAALLGDRGLTGRAWCSAHAAAADSWLHEVFRDAVRGDEAGVALLAVGGYGRGELAPSSDLDLLLVHDRQKRIGEVADAVWYPVWDSGVRLDHSVRTPKEVRYAMDSDVKVALGLLDARMVAGDADLAASVLRRCAEQWQIRAHRWLPLVHEIVRERHERFGDLAFLLEPDLKEARGGLRDHRLLMSLARVVPVVSEVARDAEIDRAGETLTAARVELQRGTGRSSDTLLLQEQDAVAAALGDADADALMEAVSAAGRVLSWAGDDSWRRVRSWLSGPRGRSGSADEPIEPGLVLRDGEVAVLADADPATDVTLALRTAAASAELDAPIARSTLERLGEEAAAPDGVWPDECRRALLRLLGAGRPAVAAIEALDRKGVWLRYLPEWKPVRNRPQRNALHRFTVDRHLVETASRAAARQPLVSRPDLLLLGALFHDIGKGRGGDHTEEGIHVVSSLGPRLGLDSDSTSTLVSLVRHHLLLPDAATRRDLDDPATAARVAELVGDRETLALLAILTEVDGLATGPAAWSDWKAGLVSRLVEQVSETLAGRPPDDARESPLGPEQQDLLSRGGLELLADGGHVTVAAPDRAGLLCTVAGVLTLSGVTVRSASTQSDDGIAMALLRFEVAPSFDRLPDWGRVRDRLAAALEGRLDLASELAEREGHYARHRRVAAAVPPAIRVLVDNDASAESTILEVRAPDRGPVLHDVSRALTVAGLTITRALISTLGSEAIDVFYVRDLLGAKILDAERLEGIEHAVVAALNP